MSGQQTPCDVAELGTLFLFEKLDDDQLDRLCREGRVELFEPGPVYTEGDPATCFYVLLEGTVVMSRRVGGDDVEISRTSQRGVYAGAMQAYLNGRNEEVYKGSVRVTEPSRFFVLPHGEVRRHPAGLVPDGRAPAGGHVLRQPEHPAHHRAARAAPRARLAVRGSHARAQQPGRRGGAGHLGAA